MNKCAGCGVFAEWDGGLKLALFDSCDLMDYLEFCRGKVSVYNRGDNSYDGAILHQQ